MMKNNNQSASLLNSMWAAPRCKLRCSATERPVGWQCRLFATDPLNAVESLGRLSKTRSLGRPMRRHAPRRVLMKPFLPARFRDEEEDLASWQDNASVEGAAEVHVSSAGIYDLSSIHGLHMLAQHLVKHPTSLAKLSSALLLFLSCATGSLQVFALGQLGSKAKGCRTCSCQPPPHLPPHPLPSKSEFRLDMVHHHPI